MAKKTNSKNYRTAITKRFLLIMEETIKAGICEGKGEFLESIGEWRQNLPDYTKGKRSPTLEQVAETCIKYDYSPTWLILGKGEKKMAIQDVRTIEDRLSLLEADVAWLKQVRKNSKK